MAKSSNTAIIGCKLPHGLHLDVNTPTGVQRITLKGGNDENAVGGYGLTEGVDADLFNEWCKQNSQHPSLAKNANVIFVAPNMGDARAKADDQSDVRTGFEGIDLERLPPGIETADSQKAQ